MMTRLISRNGILTGPLYFLDYLELPADVLAEWKVCWPDFTPEEIGGKNQRLDDRTILVDPHAMNCLQALRNARHRAVYITSAYRSDSYNRLVGGVESSMHLKGCAFDIQMWNHADASMFEIDARSAGFTGFGFYPPGKGHFIHVDTGRPREWGRRWW